MDRCKSCGKSIPKGQGIKLCVSCGVAKLGSISQDIENEAKRAIKKSKRRKRK